MTTSRRILLAAVLVAVAGAIVWLLRPPAEPVYQGKGLSYWLEGFENGFDTNHPAIEAFRNMEPTNAIPILLSALQYKPGPYQRAIWEFNRRQSIVRLPTVQYGRQNMAAGFALYAMGANARPALPVLTNLLFHSDDITMSAIALAGIGREAVPSLLSALTNQGRRIRQAAVLGLGWERSDPDLVIPALIRSLRDTNAVVQKEAVESLGHLHEEPEIVVPALRNEFKFRAQDAMFRCSVLISLAQFGDKAKGAIPTIVDALKDSDLEVSNSAAYAFKQIDPAAAARAGIK